MKVKSSLCLLLLLLCSTAVSAEADKPYPPMLRRNADFFPLTEKQKLWVLATIAVLDELNGHRHDLLGGVNRSPAERETARAMLRRWWRAENRDDLLERLKGLENGGHRRSFDQLAKVLSNLSPEEIESLRKKYEGNKRATGQIEVVNKYGKKLGKKSLVGWDFSRYVFLCQSGYIAEFLTENEAWQKSVPAARVLQNTFNSWGELGENYVIGREYWSLDETIASEAERVSMELLANPASPWRTIPWKTDLKPQKASRPAKQDNSSSSKQK